MPRFLFSVVLALLLLPASSPAQDAPAGGGCGNQLRPEHLARLEETEAKRVELPASKAGTWYFVPVSFHIVRKSNGNQGLDSADLVDILDTLNDDFRGMQIVFYAAGPTNYIDDDDFYENIDSDAEIDNLRGVDNVPNTVDIYFVKDLEGDSGPLCGISSFSFLGGPQGIVMDLDCTVNQGNPSTMTHEMGHYFDLLHTHEPANGLECVDGSNCSFAGDLVCDTPADPELGSHNVSNCAYTGLGQDSCSGLLYAPQVNNFMSYAPDACRTRFTTGQTTRALGTLLSSRADHITVAWTGSSAIYVDGRAGGIELGTSLLPYDTPAEGILFAQGLGTRLVIVAGGTYSAAFTAWGSLGDVTVVATAGTTVRFGD